MPGCDLRPNPDPFAEGGRVEEAYSVALAPWVPGSPIQCLGIPRYDRTTVGTVTVDSIATTVFIATETTATIVVVVMIVLLPSRREPIARHGLICTDPSEHEAASMAGKSSQAHHFIEFSFINLGIA